MSTQQSTFGPAADRSWHRFLDVYEPLRPELYRYCRYLTRSPWDAEDLVQDTLARAFVTLAGVSEPHENPRAWLFRVASNLWLNRATAARERLLEPEAAQTGAEPRATREAAGTLLVLLSPQERAAVVLKDVFDFSAEEIAAALETTLGAVKAALHRGRGKLRAPEAESTKALTPQVLDRFCAAFDAGDLDALTALLLDDAIVEMPGLMLERGAAAARAGTFRGTLQGCAENDEAQGLSGAPRCEVRWHRGEPILLWWWQNTVRSVLRVELRGERIARIRNYFHAPELLSEICGELALPARTNGYRPKLGEH